MNGLDRKECLEKAMKCVLGNREDEYGTPEDNFETIADMWTAYMHREVLFTPVDVAMMMTLLKVARVSTGTATDDSFVDIAGYAACGAELESIQRENEELFINDAKENCDKYAKARELGEELGRQFVEAMKRIREEKKNGN